MSKYKRYPSYKSSGVEWLGDVPSGWDSTKIKNMLSTPITDGPHETPEFLDDGIPFISAEAISKGFINFDKIRGYISIEANQKYSEKYSPMLNDVYMIKSGATTGVTAIVKDRIDFNIWSPLAVFRSSSKLHPCYLLNYLRSSNFQKAVELYWTYGTQQNIGMNVLENLHITIPPLIEQQAIADFLDNATSKIDTLITKQQDLIKLLKEKRQAVISHAVTKGLDPTVEFKDYRLDWVCGVVRGNSSFKKDELLNNGKYVALQYGKTYKIEQVDHSFNFYVNDEFYKLGQIVEYGDTILISTSETVKDLRHSCFYARSDVGLVGGEQILLKPITNTIFDKFLYYSSRFFCPKLGKYSTGLKVFRFSTDDLKNIFLSIPPLSEQQAIANYLDDKTAKIDTLVDKATQSIELLKEKRVAIISASVTGKIDVRGVV
ncbi:restriction endonuclease subunit S [Francisellaceae bacterium CB299]